MKGRIKKIVIYSSSVFALLFLIGGFLIEKYYNENVRKHPKMYCYEYIRGEGKPVSVLVIEDLDLKEVYLSYYRELESGKEPYLPDEIPLKLMPKYSPVYVIGYTQDSLLAEVVSYYNRGANFGGSFTKGWVYSKTLYENPPPRKTTSASSGKE